MGKGACRGEGWSEGAWPLAAGKLGGGDCCSRCLDTQVRQAGRQTDRQTDNIEQWKILSVNIRNKNKLIAVNRYLILLAGLYSLQPGPIWRLFPIWPQKREVLMPGITPWS